MSQHHSRAGKIVRGILYAVGAIGLLVIVWVGYYRYIPREVPKGQAPFLKLTKENVSELKESFNAADQETRVLVLLSPT